MTPAEGRSRREPDSERSRLAQGYARHRVGQPQAHGVARRGRVPGRLRAGAADYEVANLRNFAN